MSSASALLSTVESFLGREPWLTILDRGLLGLAAAAGLLLGNFLLERSKARLARHAEHERRRLVLLEEAVVAMDEFDQAIVPFVNLGAPGILQRATPEQREGLLAEQNKLGERAFGSIRVLQRKLRLLELWYGFKPVEPLQRRTAELLTEFARLRTHGDAKATIDAVGRIGEHSQAMGEEFHSLLRHSVSVRALRRMRR